jgi:hypothetical protein
MTALLSSKRLERNRLEARDLGLEEAEVHQTGTVEILALDVIDARGIDLKERDRPSVDEPDHDLA